MEFDVLTLFSEHPTLAIFISLFINIIISILGIIPSYFLTAANISFFGFTTGTIISFLGEAIGAIVSFILYRFGLKNLTKKINLHKHKKVEELLNATGMKAFYLILSLRLFPFIPSGTINIFAAFGKVSIYVFIIASTLGKIPAMLIEAYTINGILQFDWKIQITLIMFSLVFLLLFSIKKKRTK